MVSFLVAVIFIALGFIMMKFPPKKINNIYGYRTPFAMKNQEIWDEAQRHGGFSMMILGTINAGFGVWAYLQPIHLNNQTAQLLFIIISSASMIVTDELHLRKLFNQDGTGK